MDETFGDTDDSDAPHLPNDVPALDTLADDDDELDWSWDGLTSGEREEMSDDDIAGVVLFSGVPEDEIETHKAALHALQA